jgi:hypothetical protein
MPDATSVSGSVQVYGEDVEQAGEDHHHEERHVDEMPEKEQPLEGIEAGDLADLVQVFVQISRYCRFQTLGMLIDKPRRSSLSA